MNTYQWYKIVNLDDFSATGLTSRTIELVLQGIGLKDILITQGILTSLLVDGIFLPVELNDKNPFEFEERAIYIDDNNDIWYGVLDAD